MGRNNAKFKTSLRCPTKYLDRINKIHRMTFSAFRRHRGCADCDVSGCRAPPVLVRCTQAVGETRPTHTHAPGGELWFSRGKKSARLEPSKGASGQAAVLEQLRRTAGAEVVAAQLFFQELVPMDHAHPAFDVRFRWEAPTSFAHRLESIPVRLCQRSAWSTSRVLARSQGKSAACAQAAA